MGHEAAPGEARIFLSYRRGDAPHAVDRISDRLRARFGLDSIFLDIASIEPGANWQHALETALQNCDVVLVLIGPHWRKPEKAESGRALEWPDDPVRMEIRAALQRGVSIFPVLLDGAEMPSEQELPEDNAALTRRQAVRVTRERFDTDVDLLLNLLDARVGLTASSGRRVAAFCVDLLVVSALAGAIAGYTRYDMSMLILLYALYHGLACGLTGRTPGKLLVGTRIEFPPDRATRWLQAFFRPTIGYVLSIFSVVGLLQFLLHRRHSALHDRLCGTKVLHVKRRAWFLPRALDRLSYSIDLRLQTLLVRIGSVGRAVSYATSIYLGLDPLLNIIAKGLQGTQNKLESALGGETAVSGAISLTTALKLSALVLIKNAATLVTGVTLAAGSMTAYEALAPRPLKILDRPYTATVPTREGPVVVTGRDVLVILDTSGSMNGEARKHQRTAMIQQLVDVGMSVTRVELKTGGISSRDDRVARAVAEHYRTGMDTVYWFSDFEDTVDEIGIGSLRKALRDHGLRFYIGSVNRTPDALVQLAEERGGSLLHHR